MARYALSTVGAPTNISHLTVSGTAGREIAVTFAAVGTVTQTSTVRRMRLIRVTTSGTGTARTPEKMSSRSAAFHGTALDTLTADPTTSGNPLVIFQAGRNADRRGHWNPPRPAAQIFLDGTERLSLDKGTGTADSQALSIGFQDTYSDRMEGDRMARRARHRFAYFQRVAVNNAFPGGTSTSPKLRIEPGLRWQEQRYWSDRSRASNGDRLGLDAGPIPPAISAVSDGPFAAGSLMKITGSNFGLTGGTAVLTASPTDHTTGAVSQGGVYIWDDGQAWIMCDTTGLSDGTYYLHLNSFVHGWSATGFAVQVITGVTVALRSLWRPSSWFVANANPSTFVLWEAGDTVVVMGATENASSDTLATPTVSGLTFSLVTSSVVAGEAAIYWWQAVAASSGSGNVTSVHTGSGMAGMAAWVVLGGPTVSALAANNTEAGYSVAVTAGDMVVHGLVDFLASTPSKAPATGSGTASERFDTGNGTDYGLWAADWIKTAAGTFTFGPNNYTGLQVAQGGVRLAVPSGGSTFPVNVSGSIGSTGGLVRQTGKAAAGTAAPAGALAKRPARTFLGVGTSSGALSRRPGKALAGTVASGGTLANVRAILRTFTGALTSGGTLARQPQKALSGSIASSGALAKQAQRATPLGGAVLSFSGSTARSTGKALAGSLASSGALTRRPGKALAGAVSSTGSVARSIVRTLAGSIASSGVLSRRPGKTMAGTITSSGSTSFVRAILRSFVGSISPSGSASLRTGKAMAGAASLAGALTRRPQKALGGSVGPSGALAVLKAVFLSFTGSMGLSGALVRRTGKAASGTASSSGALARQIGKTMAATIASLGTLATTKAILRTFSGSIASGGVLTRRPGKAAAGQLASSGTLTRQARRSFSATIASSGSLSTARAILRAFAGTITSSGSLTRRTAKSFSGTVSAAGTVSKLVRLGLAGQLAPAGALAKAIARSFAGTLGLGGILSTAKTSTPTVVADVLTRFRFGRFPSFRFGPDEGRLGRSAAFRLGDQPGSRFGRSNRLRLRQELPDEDD